MVERSRPWSGTVLGDSGPYTDDQWSDVWKTRAPVIATQGVFLNQLNDLVLSGLPITPVDVASGRALVNGIWYESDASVAVAIPTPAANPRVDRIVLRADWALQTVRLTRIAGAEAAAPTPPALTQVDGVTWDLPLWQVHDTVGGVITFYRDERSFIGQYEPSEPTDEFVYMEDEFFWPGAIAATADTGKWNVTVVGNYSADPTLTGFGGGAVRMRFAGPGAGSLSITCVNHRPDVINGHFVTRTKSPNTDALLDRAAGFGTGLAAAPATGVMFRAIGAGNWFAVCGTGAAETAVDTTIALDNTWRKFEIRQTGTNVVVFLIDDVVRANIQTNIPAVDLTMGYRIFDGGAPAVQDYLHIDRVKLAGDR